MVQGQEGILVLGIVMDVTEDVPRVEVVPPDIPGWGHTDPSVVQRLRPFTL